VRRHDGAVDIRNPRKESQIMSARLKLAGGILTATGLALGAIAVTGTPANASASDCPSEYVCAFTYENFGGYMGKDIDDDDNWSNSIENEDDSWVNHGTGTGEVDVLIYTKHDQEGDAWCLRQGAEIPDNDSLDHRGSSHEWVEDC
jgi:Peptidase inhibitor family I36